MKPIPIPLLFLLAGLALPAIGAELACPDLARAVQVASCPSDEELRYTFTGYCSDDKLRYKGDTDVCTTFESYRQFKNLALWESADGNFSAYVSCDRAPEAVKATRATSVRVARQGRINLVVCGYGDGLNFTHRTRAECRVSTASCAGDASACKAICD